MTIKEKQEDIIKLFEQAVDWEDKYRLIIDLGKQMPILDKQFKTEKYKLSGCQSQVWINAKYEDGKIFFEADSDAAIVKGLVAILIKVYSESKSDEILANPPTFLQQIGIDKHLSPTRKNGLSAMMKQIQMYALAFKAMETRRGS